MKQYQELKVYPVIKRVRGTFFDTVMYLNSTEDGARIQVEKLTQIYGKDAYCEFLVGDGMFVIFNDQ